MARFPKLKNKCRSLIIDGNVESDNLFLGDRGFWDGHNHGDNNELQATIGLITTRWFQSLDCVCRSCDKIFDNFTLLGKMLHAIQDIYSHSNWVEQTGGGTSHAPIWNMWDSDNTAIIPDGITSGVYAGVKDDLMKKGGTPEGLDPAHWEMNKDNPDSPAGKAPTSDGKTMFDAAIDVAQRHTAAFVSTWADRFSDKCYIEFATCCQNVKIWMK